MYIIIMNCSLKETAPPTLTHVPLPVFIYIHIFLYIVVSSERVKYIALVVSSERVKYIGLHVPLLELSLIKMSRGALIAFLPSSSVAV